MAPRKKKIVVKTKMMTAMTYNGAATLFKFYKTHYNVELIEDRKQHEDGVQWTFVMSDPFSDES